MINIILVLLCNYVKYVCAYMKKFNTTKYNKLVPLTERWKIPLESNGGGIHKVRDSGAGKLERRGEGGKRREEVPGIGQRSLGAPPP